MDMTLYNNIINTLCPFKSDKSHIIHKKKRKYERLNIRYESCAQHVSGPQVLPASSSHLNPTPQYQEWVPANDTKGHNNCELP